MKKRILCFVLILVMTIGMLSTIALADTPTLTLKSCKLLTRKELCAILADIFDYGLGIELTGELLFSDVPVDHEYAKAIEWAKKLGIVSGYLEGDGTYSFRPDEMFTRSELAQILYKCAIDAGIELEEAVDYTTICADVKNNKWYTNAVNSCLTNNILTTTMDNGLVYFNLNKKVVVADLVNIFNLFPDENIDKDVYSALSGSSEHMYGDYVSNNDATTENDGTKTRTCSVCGDEDTVIDEGSKITSVTSGTYDDLTYEIADDEVTITGCNTSATTVTIPSEIEGYPVTAIGNRAFFRCHALTSITIPDSVTAIGDSAFGMCGSIESITIPDSVTTIDSSAFYGCVNLAGIFVGENSLNFFSSDGVLYNKTKTELICCPGGKKGSFTIPDSVTKIGENSFYACLSLKSITIPDSVTSIGEGAFYDCGNLENIIVSDGVTIIGYSVFCGCENLKSIIIPDSVTTIDSCAFLCCYSLETVNYHGTEQDRENIQIDTDNTCLLDATWNYGVHIFDNACDSKCNWCDYTREAPHNWSEYVSDSNATTEKDGTKTRVCSVCGAKDTVTDVGSKLPIPEPKPEEKPVEIKDTTKIFTDVKAKKWYTNAVNYAYSHGFIAGVSDTEFGRDVPVTRGMFITILARIAGVDTSSKSNKVTTKFTDVKSGKYYTNAIKWASENGVVNGLTDTTFGPNSAIERQQLCTMIVNFAKYMKIDLKATQQEIKFADATSIRKYAKNAVSTCQKAGVVSGYAVDGGTEFKPLNTATRAEAAQILYKFHKDFVA